jgi:hypothetical protein
MSVPRVSRTASRSKGALRQQALKLGIGLGQASRYRDCRRNARVEPRGNAIITTRQASGSAKIDPLMTAFNAIALMATNRASALTDSEAFFCLTMPSSSRHWGRPNRSADGSVHVAQPTTTSLIWISGVWSV